MGKIARKLLAHYINASKVTETPVYERIGRDLEEYNVEMSASTETKKNILGEQSVNIASYEKTGEVSPYYADQSDALFTRLQNIIDNNETLDDLKSDMVDVHLWEPISGSSVKFKAVKWPGMIEVKSYGGDTNGYAIPYTFKYTEEGIKGTFDIQEKTFVADETNVVNAEL